MRVVRAVGGDCSALVLATRQDRSPEDCAGWAWEAAELVQVGREIERRVPATPYADEDLASWQRGRRSGVSSAKAQADSEIISTEGSKSPLHPNTGRIKLLSKLTTHRVSS
jgi:hypothetical protein